MSATATSPVVTMYRSARDAYIAACAQSDQAFARYMRDEVKTARGAGRLAARVEQTGGECDAARYEAEDWNYDTRVIDANDGLVRDGYTGLYTTKEQTA